MSGYFSDDAESWTPVGEHTVSGTITEVRLIAGRAQLEPAVAEFDYFTLSPQGTATDATGSGHRRQSHEHGQLGIPLPLPGWRK